MQPFLDATSFLLPTESARTLYRAVEQLPIYDCHNHLDPREIYENRPYASLTELWLARDHYKWRAMRAAGVPETLITGDGDEREKFRAWAATVARLPLCPLYHWTHLELRRYFGIDEPLCPDSADAIYDRANALLATDGFRPRALLARMRVDTLCTTDNPWDTLTWHRQLADETLPFTVRPSFRPDRLMQPEAPGWREAVDALSAAEGIPVRSYDDLLAALTHSLDRFAALGCRAADHGFSVFDYLPSAHGAAAMDAALAGEALSPHQALALRSNLLRDLATAYARRGMVMQLHTGPVRNPYAAMYARLGPDSGYDCMGGPQDPAPYHACFSELAGANALPKTVLYSIHPADAPMFASMAVTYCGETPGRMQLGSAWWFNDTLDGMRAQLTAAAESGLLSSFVGMLTDSRSMTAFVRHEYFRRLLCQMLGGAVERGEFPAARMDDLTALARDVCYHNAKRYFEQEDAQ